MFGIYGARNLPLARGAKVWDLFVFNLGVAWLVLARGKCILAFPFAISTPASSHGAQEGSFQAYGFSRCRLLSAKG